MLADTQSHSTCRTTRPWAIALAGMASLAVAMGVGRFAFTPLMPVMLQEGRLDLPAASWLATANYFGYLVGALLCFAQPWLWNTFRVLRRLNSGDLVHWGLIATVALTAAMLIDAPASWPLLRFLAGVATAVVFVYTSGWCLARLATLKQASLGGIIYVGPGLGIALSGLAVQAMSLAGWTSRIGWLVFSVLAAVLTAMLWRTIQGPSDHGSATAAPTRERHEPARSGRAEQALFALAYGLAGFGYIITATFLPVIARETIAGSPWLDMFWPILGLGVATGALLASRMDFVRDFRLALAGIYLVQAIGVVASLVSPSVAGFAIGSFLVGMPLTSITFFAMREARRLREHNAASFMGLLTAVYGIGQILGPPVAAGFLTHSASHARGFELALGTAALTLVLGTVLYLTLYRFFPMRRAGA